MMMMTMRMRMMWKMRMIRYMKKKMMMWMWRLPTIRARNAAERVVGSQKVGRRQRLTRKKKKILMAQLGLHT